MSRPSHSPSPHHSYSSASLDHTPSSHSSASSSPTRPVSANRILASLSDHEYARIAPHLCPVELPLEKVLCHSGECLKRVYFMERGLISIVLTSVLGNEVEVGLMGSEGVVGGLAAMSDAPLVSQLLVQTSGAAMVMPVVAFREEFARGGQLQTGVLRHAQEFSVQSSQTALCNRLHSIEERLARWLLMVYNRTQQEHLELTQEFLAQMLGSRRSGVTIAAGSLRRAGLIEYTRGKIEIVDRQGLEDVACECYAVIRDHAGFAVA